MTARRTSWLGFIAALSLYLVRVFPWATAQLWIDEVITLYNYAGAFHPGTTLGSVFRNYTLANNHILSTAIYWLWLKAVPVFAPEILLRLPSLVFGALTLAVIVFWWRKWLGTSIAVLGAVVFAASPVFPAFAYQIRGYSLSMLLAAVGVALVATVLEEAPHRFHWKAQAALLLLGVLQPLIMPSAALFPAAIALWLALARHPGERLFGTTTWQRIASGIPSAVGGLLGLAYYLTLGEQFRLARLDAGEISADWWTTSSSATHVLLAMAAHLGVLLLPLTLSLFYKNIKQLLKNKVVIILLSWFVAEGLMYVAAGRATVPFPRNSLVFFPMVTFAALLAIRALPRRFLKRGVVFGTGVLAVLLGISITAWQEAVCLKLVRAGDIPQDLLKQQYRGDDSIRTVVRNLHDAGLCDTTYLLVSDNDGTVAKWHYEVLGHSPQRVYDRTLLLANPRFWEQSHGSTAPVFVVARLAPEADQLYGIAQYPLPRKCLMELKYRDFYGPQ
ncbi:MAG: hypothetical protein IKO65_00080 [Victivallales bacterium]|nr:hypothetical protein [Victivallales bacterium]